MVVISTNIDPIFNPRAPHLLAGFMKHTNPTSTDPTQTVTPLHTFAISYPYASISFPATGFPISPAIPVIENTSPILAPRNRISCVRAATQVGINPRNDPEKNPYPTLKMMVWEADVIVSHKNPKSEAMRMQIDCAKIGEALEADVSVSRRRKRG